MLPTGSQIIVSLVDVGLRHAVPQRINTIVLRDSYHFPIPFEIPYSISQLQTNSNSIQQYAIQAQIEQDDKLLYINDQYTPVQLIPASHNPINIMMKNVDASPTRSSHIFICDLIISDVFVLIYSDNGEIYTTRAPSVNNMHICLQIPEIGPCRARIEQYYFDAQLGSCQIFYWGGCVGNQNRFNSRDECESTCWFNRRQETTNDIKQIYTS